MATLICSWVKTGYVAHGHFCCIHRYTRTRVASRPSRAIQLYSAVQRYIHYTAIHRYTLYNLYNTPLGNRRKGLSHPPSASVVSGRRLRTRLALCSLCYLLIRLARSSRCVGLASGVPTSVDKVLVQWALVLVYTTVLVCTSIILTV